MQETSLAIGIDVGWSEKKRTCAIGLKGNSQKLLDELRRNARFTIYKRQGGDSEFVAVGVFRKSELIAFLKERIPAWAQMFRRIFLIVDGPLGKSTRPTKNRHVDSAFRRGIFNGRVQPSDICSTAGQTYVEATYDLLQCFFDFFNGVDEIVQALFGAVSDHTRLVFGETHPTVGLCLCLPPQEINSLPSRGNPLLSSKDDCTYRAKSDWYWRIGAAVVAGMLLGADLKSERDHERIAGLYCLAVADRLRSPGASGNSIIACGMDDGVYIFPNEINPEWSGPLKDKIGIYAGTPILIDQPVIVPDTIEIPGADIPPAAFLPDELEEKADGPLDLILYDNAGIWEQHNLWLRDLDPRVCLSTVGSHSSNPIKFTLCRSKAQGLWLSKPSTSSLSKQTGYQVPHLSKTNPWRIRVEVVCDGCK